MGQIQISSKEANKMFFAFKEFERDAVRLYKLIVQKINRYKVPRKLDPPFFIKTNEGEKVVTYVTNDSIYLTLKKGATDIVPIRDIPINILLMLNLRLGENVTAHTKGKF
jgi:hypothetical protein